MQHKSGDGIQVRLAGKTGNLDVLKAMAGESRRVDLALLVTIADVAIRCTRFPQVLGHQSTIWVQHLTIPKRDAMSRRTCQTQANRAGEVLAEIEDIGSLGAFGDLDRSNFISHSNGHTGKGFQLWPNEREINLATYDLGCTSRFGRGFSLVERGHLTTVLFSTDGRLPGAVVKADLRPCRQFHASVVAFAHQQIGFTDRPVAGDFPRLIRTEDLARTVVVLNLQLS